jgi:hypothetical protein
MLEIGRAFREICKENLKSELNKTSKANHLLQSSNGQMSSVH